MSPEMLRALLRYEPDTGKLYWRERPIDMFRSAAMAGAWNTKFAGKEAFTSKDTPGYHKGRIFKQFYLAHRVIWAMQTGAWPERQVDHINLDRTDNRWANLRAATQAENQRNTSSREGSSSKYLGVSWRKDRNKWKACIRHNGRLRGLGTFGCEADAAHAYDKAAAQFHGEFASLNFPASERVAA
jgi:hypothetical protein